MYNNVFKKIPIRPCKDLTKPTKNRIVLEEDFMFEVEDNNHTAKYDEFIHHTMIHDISLARRFGLLILFNHLGYTENVNTISGRSSHEYDTNISK